MVDTVSRSFDWLPILIRVSKSVFHFFLFFFAAFELYNTNLKYVRAIIVIISSIYTYVYSCYVSTYIREQEWVFVQNAMYLASKSSPRIFVISRASHWIKEYLSFLELLTLRAVHIGELNQGCRRYGPSFLLTGATTADSDTVTYVNYALDPVACPAVYLSRETCHIVL